MLAILTYHSIDGSGSVVSVPPRTFTEQMATLAEWGYRGISLTEAVRYRQANGSWPQRCVVLTFDDGFANFYESAMPALMRRNFSATVFLISGHVEKINDWDTPPARLGTRQMLSWRQVRELSEQGIEIGAHTRKHPDLRRLPESQLEEEIAGSCAEISDHIGQAVESFAYPYGYSNHQVEDVVRRTVRAACTTELRHATDDPLHLLPRLDMYYLQSPHQVQSLVTEGLVGYLALRRWGRAVRQKLSVG
ncbi:MAG: polysaccharide deacetylase family protein [Acidobacteria bacterium]|nr:polysaccharide deacetylase family protein [Acidobacteriota bacterium]